MPNDVSNLSIIKDVVIAIAAFTGMGLGLFNLWSEKQKDKVKLEVIPKSVKNKGVSTSGQQFIITTANDFIFDQELPLFAFEVINHSKFDVTINEIGFFNSKTNGRYSIPEPILKDSGKWPRKLEPRESVTLYADLSSIFDIEHLPFVTSAFAVTSCNHTETGVSESLIQLVRHAQKCV
jgi:hypothetical protein